VSVEETTHRGVRWQRDHNGRLRFYDGDGARWVTWAPGVDAPPLPPGWGGPRRPGRVARPGWRSRWRLVPLGLTVVVVVIAVIQALRPAGNPVAKEAAASAGMLGACLVQNGTAEGRPKYSAKPVTCTAPTASVRVVKVIPSTPGSRCPTNTTPMELPYAGVQYPHILCVEAVRPGG
jgi:hypothetical protein